MIFFFPSSIIIYFILLSSIFIIISSQSWFIIWVALELNILSFIPIIIKKNNKYSIEAAIKYFLIQTYASIIIFLITIPIALNGPTFIFIVTTSIILTKIGAAPIHRWYTNLITGLSWPAIFALSTIQKLGPLTLLILTHTNSLGVKITYLFSILSALVGSIGGLSISLIKKIIAYSSISHLAWLMLASTINFSLIVNYFIMYTFISIPIFSFISKNQITRLSQILPTCTEKLSSYLISFSLLSLGGLPPFFGFLPKLLVLTKLNFNYFLSFTLLFSSFISLFFYIRIILAYFFNSRTNYWKPNVKRNKIIIINIIGLFLPTLIMLIL